MATPEEISALKRRIGETTLSDEELGLIFDREGNLDGATGAVWEMKAAEYSELVNVSEAGSSRSLGDLYKNAVAMAKYWRDSQHSITPIVPVARRTTTRAIVRPQ